MATIQTIDKSYTPNQLRIKVNENFNNMNNDSTSFISKDGTRAMEADFDFGGYKGINLGAGISPTDAVNMGQMWAVMYKQLAPYTIYMIPGFSGSEVMYLDGTSGKYAVRVGTLADAWTAINADTTSGVDWTIKVSNHSQKYTDSDFTNAVEGTSIIGDGKPIFETDDDITVKLYIENVKIHNTTNEFDVGGGSRLERVDLGAGDWIAPSTINFGNIFYENGNVFATGCEIDSTAGNVFINNVKLQADFGHPERNNPYAITQILSNLTDLLPDNFE